MYFLSMVYLYSLLYSPVSLISLLLGDVLPVYGILILVVVQTC